MRFELTVSCGNDFADYPANAVVEMTPRLAEEIKRLAALVKWGCLYKAEVFDDTPDWGDLEPGFEDEENGDSDLEGFGGGYEVTCASLCVTEDGFFWQAYLGNENISLETATVPLESLGEDEPPKAPEPETLVVGTPPGQTYVDRIPKARQAIQTALRTCKDKAILEGLNHARTLIEEAIPDLAAELENTTDALDNASEAVDPSDMETDEEYAYQHELESAREALRRINGYQPYLSEAAKDDAEAA